MSGKLEKILNEIRENPSVTAGELVGKFEVSRQYISQITKANKITLQRRRFKYQDRVWTNHFGGKMQLASHFVGGASELTAASDLLRKGVPVYRALTFVGKADLIIDINDRLLKVEVKSAKRNKCGHLTYAKPVDEKRYDILALVEPNGAVTYRPEIVLD